MSAVVGQFRFSRGGAKVGAVLVCCLLGLPCFADSTNPVLSLVRLSAELEADEKGNIPRRTATGFVISRDGTVLTVRGLIPGHGAGGNAGGGWLGAAKIEATLASPSGKSEQFRAPIIDLNDQLGLILIKLTPLKDADEKRRRFNKVRLGDVDSIGNGQPIYARGYVPGSNNPVKVDGTFGDDGPWSLLRTLDLGTRRVAPMPGFPIFASDDRVVGITTGTGMADGNTVGADTPDNLKDRANKWYFIPITYADMLLTHDRLSFVRDALARLSGEPSMSWHLTEELSSKLSQLNELNDAVEELRNQLQWKLETGDPTVCELKVSYTKVLAGGRGIFNGTAKVDFSYRDGNSGNDVPFPTLIGKTPFPVTKINDLSGYVCLDNLATRMRDAVSQWEPDNLKILVTFVPTAATGDGAFKNLDEVKLPLANFSAKPH